MLAYSGRPEAFADQIEERQAAGGPRAVELVDAARRPPAGRLPTGVLQHLQVLRGRLDRSDLGFRAAFADTSFHDPVLWLAPGGTRQQPQRRPRASQASPRSRSASVRAIAIVAAVSPVVWGAGQLAPGWPSDHTGRKPLITGGMLVQAAASRFPSSAKPPLALSVAAAALLGTGTAMVYPTLIAVVSDATQPREPARAVGVYRFWREVSGPALGVPMSPRGCGNRTTS